MRVRRQNAQERIFIPNLLVALCDLAEGFKYCVGEAREIGIGLDFPVFIGDLLDMDDLFEDDMWEDIQVDVHIFERLLYVSITVDRPFKNKLRPLLDSHKILCNTGSQ